MNFYLSSCSSLKSKLVEVILDITSMCVKNIELSGTIEYSDTLEQDVLNMKAEYDLKYLLHNYFPPARAEFVINFASTEKSEITRSFELAGESMRYAKLLGLKHLSFHCGSTARMLPKIRNSHFTVVQGTVSEKNVSKRIFYDNIDVLCNSYIKDNCMLAFENLFPRNSSEDYSLISTMKDILEFAEYSRQYKNLGLLLDLGHLNVASKIYGFNPRMFAEQIMTDYKDKIIELHVSGNDGDCDCHKITELNSWQMEFVKNNLRVFDKTPIIYEWSGKSNKRKDLVESVKRYKDLGLF